jgi:hypothetical protein
VSAEIITIGQKHYHSLNYLSRLMGYSFALPYLQNDILV